MITASRYHDFSAGHRVFNHGSKCADLHGHNYRIHFECQAPTLDDIGRVIDFGEIKSKLCMWLETNWDHKFLIFEDDPWADPLKQMNPSGVVITSFNPTAENMGLHLLNAVAPGQLIESSVKLVKVTVEETRKCSASVYL